MVNSQNARIFGSDSDSIYLAPVGTVFPTTIGEVAGSGFEDVGWLHSDGITEAFTGSKAQIRGHQGARVVRTRMETPGLRSRFMLWSRSRRRNLFATRKRAVRYRAAFELRRALQVRRFRLALRSSTFSTPTT